MSIRRARQLRRNQTETERRLWSYLRNRRFEGFKFRRQVPIGAYVADFCCFDARLVVEVDGGQHADRSDSDEKRTSRLNAQGFRVLRFWNNEVWENKEAVLCEIAKALGIDWAQTPPHPDPLPQGEREK